MSNTVRVWDLPTRVFHWALVACVIGLVTTAQIGGDAMEWHFRFGYTVLSLLLFRIVWGVVGGRWSRFASFVYSPATVLKYVKGQGRPEHSVGHNPLGAGSVFALLGFLLLQVASGLISDDEIATSGPLSQFASNAMVQAATFYHKNIGKPILIGLIVLHIAAILFYLVKKRENLVRPMIAGDKDISVPTEGSRDDARSRALATVLFSACAALVAWMVQLAG
jgi:cytochrome b